VDESEKDGSTGYDFANAWGHPHAFALIKTGIMKLFMARDDFSPENPYEQLIATLTATGMIHSAYELGKNIEVRYGWELLDDENIIMHSCFGVVEKIDIRIKSDELGFLLDMGDDDYAAFAYKDIFWVCEAK
jgi:hypothetical protein